MTRTARPLLIACVLVLFWAVTGRADNWPQWRGPDNDGVCKETNLPTEWGADKNLAWKLPLPGPSGATPAVWGDHIFLTSEEGTSDVVLLCVGTDGKELWKKKLGSARVRTMGNEGNAASPSPSTDGKHVWAFAASGDLACF